MVGRAGDLLGVDQERRSDADASQNAYVATSARDQGSATFTIPDAEAGTYALSARVLAETGASNSLYLSVNGGSPVGWFFGAQPDTQQPQQTWDVDDEEDLAVTLGFLVTHVGLCLTDAWVGTD